MSAMSDKEMQDELEFMAAMDVETAGFFAQPKDSSSIEEKENKANPASNVIDMTGAKTQPSHDDSKTMRPIPPSGHNDNNDDWMIAQAEEESDNDEEDYPDEVDDVKPKLKATTTTTTTTRAVAAVAAVAPATVTISQEEYAALVRSAAMNNSAQTNTTNTHTSITNNNAWKQEVETQPGLTAYSGEAASKSSGSSKFRAGNTPLETLQNFGMPSFRAGQEKVIQATLAGRDSAVFWATGLGKSLCYQIPALHSGKTAFIVSPLISLMQDQCIKLNNLCNTNVATFLGSGQNDGSADARALRGEYLLVYLTPEKITSDGFLSAMASLHNRGGGLSLVAVDEAHCVSEWGHDFRPAFRLLGKIRECAELRSVPIMALTATAVPRVQEDICNSLRMHAPEKAVSSFDRPNLRLEVFRKPKGGKAIAMTKLVKEMKERPLDNSTIVYAPTTADVDSVAELLAAQLNRVCKVMPYHAKLSPSAREDAHKKFLSGEVQIIVATVAFGMGIDKPDTRRVIHWGSPKTVEEYYQQVGRAGRDGLSAECTMWADLNDFSRYKDDYYMKAYSDKPVAKQAILRSLNALQTMAMSDTECRRAALLQFFEEVPKFGQRCGNCDCCSNAVKYSNDTERDFAPSARVICTALAHLVPSAVSVLDKVLAGKEVEVWRYTLKSERGAAAATTAIAAAQSAPGANEVPDLCRNLLPSLVSAGWLVQIQQSSTGFRSWSTFGLTPKGRNLVNNRSCSCMLPVPECIRQEEKDAQDKKDAAIRKLKDAGADLASIPRDQLERGSGPAFDATNNFYSAVVRAESYNLPKALKMRALKDRIVQWRAATARTTGKEMSPAYVLSEEALHRIALSASGTVVNEEAAKQLGATHKTAELVSVIAIFCKENGLNAEPVSSSEEGGSPMVDLPEIFQPAPWSQAVYLPNKPWERSAEMFERGMMLSTISSDQGMDKKGQAKKAVLASTIGGHLLQAITFGRHKVNLKRLATEFTAPNSKEWADMEKRENEFGVDVVETITLSKAEFLESICPDVKVPFPERTEENKIKVTRHYRYLEWYITLRRVGYRPTFAASATTFAPSSSQSPASVFTSGDSSGIKRSVEGWGGFSGDNKAARRV